MRTRWKLLIIIALVMLVVVGAWVLVVGIEPAREADAYRNSLIAKGEKLEIAEVMPPPVPPGQNGAEIVRGAFGLFVPTSDDFSNMPQVMRMVAPGKAMACFNQTDVRGLNFTNSWTNVMEVVEEDSAAAALLKQAMNYPVLDFQVEYEKWPDLPLSHLAPFKRCVLNLSRAAIYDLHEGDGGEAATNICVMLSLIKGVSDERTLISQLVLYAMVQITVGPTWECLQSTNVNDAELAMMQTNWQRLEFTHAMENAMLMERAGNESAIQKMRTSDEFFNHIVTGGSSSAGGTPTAGDLWDDAKFAGAKFMWRTSWTYSDELLALKNDQIALEAIRTVETNGFFNPAYSNMVSQLSVNEPTNDPDSWAEKLDESGLKWMFSEDIFGMDAYVSRAMAAETAKRIVVTAIALRRYQLKHGDYPTNLDSLVPEFVSTVPLDPVDGKPLRYRRNTDGTFLLYSIGSNGTDDGGDPSLGPGAIGKNFYWLNQKVLDWVWPQPATAAEIKYFYEHPPR